MQLRPGRLAQATQHLVSPEPRPGPESRRAPAHPGSRPEPVAAPVTAASLPRLARVQPPRVPRLTLKPSGLRAALCSLSFPTSEGPTPRPPGNAQPAPSASPASLKGGEAFARLALGSRAAGPLPPRAGCCPPPLASCLLVWGVLSSFSMQLGQLHSERPHRPWLASAACQGVPAEGQSQPRWAGRAEPCRGASGTPVHKGPCGDRGPGAAGRGLGWGPAYGVGEGREPGGGARYPSPGGTRQENCPGFEACVGYIVGPCFKTEKRKSGGGQAFMPAL